MFKVRFHLGAGEHFQHWQVTNRHTGEVTYYDPAVTSLELFSATLRNQPATARKIHQGANKSVCAWIECSSVLVVRANREIVQACEGALDKLGSPCVRYNPKIAPNWIDDAGNNIDGAKFSQLSTIGRRVRIQSIS
jgi:hypothetical protein